MPSSVDVVIVAYNRYDLTESCLRHLAAQTREHKVILVENGSTDDTRARLSDDWPEVQASRSTRGQPQIRATRQPAQHLLRVRLHAAGSPGTK